VLLSSCKTRYKVTSTSSEETVERIITTVNPYDLSSKGKLYIVDGNIKPIELKVVSENNQVEAIASVSDGELNLVLKRKDTLIVKEIQTNVITTNNEVTKIEKTKWSKFKNNIFWASMIFSIITLLVIAFRAYLKLKPI